MQNKTAILVFANSSQEELSHKAIPKSKLLFDLLTQQTLDTVKKTKLPYFHLTEEQQVGGSFGERFTNAIQFIFAKGFDHIITIGNDTPHLKVAHILDAGSHLKNGKAVLGPSADGGFYLMALHRSQFNISDFKKLTWKSSKLFLETSRLFAAQNVVLVQLKTLFDLDTVSDLQVFINQYASVSNQLFRSILSLLRIRVKKIHFRFTFCTITLSETYFNKGSPSALYQ
ncbi:MAG: DUF2064 domain-containing protein [Flavobacteriaceae bacterium]